jgi:MoaA/NifB/PqqE/SkfB family radical SAM enzyme
MKYPIKITQSEPTVNIYWKLTDFCNFKCNYCPDYLHSGNYALGRKPGFPTDSNILSFISQLENGMLQGKHLNLLIGGGEPTVHPLFPEIVNRLKHENHFLGVLTNGSRSEDWWQQILPMDNVVISLHPEFTNVEKINAISKFIISSGTSLIFNLSCDPANWDKTIELYNNIDDSLKHLISPKVLNYLDRPTKENYTYSDQQKDWIRKHISYQRASAKFKNANMHFNDGSVEGVNLSKLTINGWNKYKGWSCKADSQSLMINFDGNVYAGVCQAKKLGHISTFSKIEDNGLICPYGHCDCPTDIRSEKYKVS